MTISIKHVTPNRVRFIFSNTLSPLEYLFLKSTFLYYYPYLILHKASLDQGCVIVSNKDHHVDAIQVQTWLHQYFLSPPTQGPLPPPTQLERVGRKTKKISIKAMLVFALLGWILPILPGTPFFLMAWWLGWRPSAKAKTQPP